MIDAVKIARAVAPLLSSKGEEHVGLKEVPAVLSSCAREIVARTSAAVLSSNRAVSTLHSPDVLDSSWHLRRKGNGNIDTRKLRRIQEMRTAGITAADCAKLDSFVS